MSTWDGIGTPFLLGVKSAAYSGFFVSVIQRGLGRVILLWRAVLGTLVVAVPSTGSSNPLQPVAQRLEPLSTVIQIY
jgi:hypothetical protein